MANLLLLGPGKSRARFRGPDFDPYLDVLTVIDFDPEAALAWPNTLVYQFDLRGKFGFLLPTAGFDEVHAYELLNLLPGDETDFYRLWRQLWDAMKPGATLTATVPHWTSPWIHAYPAPQRVYTPGLLAYLDPLDGLAHKGGEFDLLWPAPYRFSLVESLEDAQRKSYVFVLRKETL